MLYNIQNNPTTLKKFEKEVLGKHAFVFLIYADWCGHCQQLKGDWNNAVNSSKSSTHIIQISDQDMKLMNTNFSSSDMNAIVKKSFSGFPHIASVSAKRADGSYAMTNFENGRNEKQFVEFFKMSKPSTTRKASSPARASSPKPKAAPKPKKVAPKRKMVLK
jgi:thiol-disulfide isomerase/thioredoxin